MAILQKGTEQACKHAARPEIIATIYLSPIALSEDKHPCELGVYKLRGGPGFVRCCRDDFRASAE